MSSLGASDTPFQTDHVNTLEVALVGGDAPDSRATTDPNRISFLVTGVYKFRVGVRRSGSTDAITSADLSLRKDGVNA